MSFIDIPCQVCRQLLGEETFVVLSDGFVHPRCWREEKPSYYETTFAEFVRRATSRTWCGNSWTSMCRCGSKNAWSSSSSDSSHPTRA